jgi:hypothetical protein
MVDKNIQARAGQNVGNQPGGMTFVAKSYNRTVEVKPNTRVVLWEGIEGGLRVPGSLLSDADAGVLFNQDTVNGYNFTLYFVDDQGNSLPLDTGSIDPGTSTSVPANEGLELGGLNQEGVFALCAGERIEIQAVAAIE